MEGMSDALQQKLLILRGGPPAAAQASQSAAPSSNAMTPEEMMKQLTPEDIEELQRVYEEMSNRMAGGGDGGGDSGDLPERKLELPGGRTLGREGLRDKPLQGIIITPDPGFVFKCKRLGKPSGGTSTGGAAARLMVNPPDYHKDNAGCKVFVNVCQSEKLALPGIKKRLDESGEEVEGMNIPMSVGAPRASSDSKGEPCVVYDIIVHSNVIGDSVADRTGKYRDFVCQVSIVSLEQKYGEQLDRRYKLPKMRAMGELASQQIRDVSKEPKIAEVDRRTATQPSSAAAAAAKFSAAKVKAKTAEMEVPEIELRCRISLVVHTGEGSPPHNAAALLARAVEGVNGQGTEFESREVESAARQGEYADPLATLAVPGGAVVALLVRCVVARKAVSDMASLDVQLSPYRIAIKLPRYRASSLYSPFVLMPAHCCSYVRALHDKSNIEDVELVIVALADSADWSSAPDAGSRAWLVSQALDDYSGDGGIYSSSSSSSSSSSKVSAGDAAGASTGAAAAATPSPEDVFHLRHSSSSSERPLGPEDIDSIELPEDRFHAKDAASSYIINQRDEATTSKKEKAAKERAERVSDPSVEYIDVEDFAPGGKYAPQGSADAASPGAGGAQGAELTRAAQVLQRTVADKEQEGGAAVGTLSSSAWAELL